MSDFSRVAKKLRDLKDDIEDEVDTATKRGAKTLRAQTRREALREDNIARGKLATDIRSGTQPQDATILSARRVHLPEWAKYLEHGTGIHSDEGYPAPSEPPYGHIWEWFESPFGPEPKTGDVWASTKLVAESIEEEGNMAHPFIDSAWNGPNGYRNVVDENKRALRKAVRRL